MIKLTGLWKNVDKNGNDYFTGTLGNARICIYANTYKTADKQPDFYLYLDEQKKKKDDNGNIGDSYEVATNNQSGEANAFIKSDASEELPF